MTTLSASATPARSTLRYDLAWLASLLAAIAVMRATHFAGIAPAYRAAFPWVFPFAIAASIVAHVVVHRAYHDELPRSINRIFGEIFGAFVLTRFVGWGESHRRRRGVTDAGDDTLRATVTFTTNIALGIAWWGVLGDAATMMLFVPAALVGWLYVAHFDRGTCGLAFQEIAPFGPIWFPRGGAIQMKNLGSEVREYFHPSLELRPGDVVLDVGANVGAFAIEAATVAPDLRIVCVEPIPRLFDALARNFDTHPSLRGARKTLVCAGLTFEGDARETEFTYFSRLPCDSTRHLGAKRREFERFFAGKGASVARRIQPWTGGMLARLVERSVANLPKGTVGRWVSDRSVGATTVRCPLTTLDELCVKANVSDIGLLKIDVEGAELDVLRGISPHRFQRVRQVVLEGHDEDGRKDAIERLLRAHGYELAAMTPAIAEDRALNNFLIFAWRPSASS